MSKYSNLFTQASFAGTEFEVGKAPKLDGLHNPAYAVSESVLAGVRGTRFNQALMRKRQVTMELIGRCQDETEYWQKRGDILAACNKENGEDELLLTVGGSQYRLSAVPEPPEISWPKFPYFTYLLQFTCYDPVIYSAQETEVEGIQTPSGGGFIFNIKFNLKFTGGSQTGRVSVDNLGNIPTYPRLILTGPLTNPVIENEETGQFFKLNLTIPAGVVVEIDMGLRRALRDGLTNVAQYIDDGSEWWPLYQGQNDIRITTDSTGDSGNLGIVWSSTWGQL